MSVSLKVPLNWPTPYDGEKNVMDYVWIPRLMLLRKLRGFFYAYGASATSLHGKPFDRTQAPPPAIFLPANLSPIVGRIFDLLTTKFVVLLARLNPNTAGCKEAFFNLLIFVQNEYF